MNPNRRTEFWAGAGGVLGFAVLAYGVAAWSLVALTWDGAGYLFNSLQAGAPVIAHHRYSNYPTLWAVVEAARWVESPWALGVWYGLLLAVTPVGALGLSWWFLRGERLAGLRMWPVLGILWGALPGEICLISEASLAVQVFWPVLAWVAAGLPAAGAWWMAGVLPYLFFLHPTTAAMFLLAGGLCGGLAVGRREKRFFGWAVVFLGLAAARVAYSVATATAYERGELGWEANWQAYLGGLRGAPLLLVGCMYVFGGAWLAGVRRGSRVARWVAWGAVAGFLFLGGWWAADARLWAGAIGYRRFVLAAALPLMAMGGVHWWWLQRGKARTQAGPGGMGTVVAAGFAVVFVVQALGWRVDVVRFARELKEKPGAFVTREELPWMRGRALDHWGASMLSVIVQGRTPAVLYAESRGQIKGDDLELYPGGWIWARDGWFRLAPEHRRGD